MFAKTANIFTFKSAAIKPGNVKDFHPTLLIESKFVSFNIRFNYLAIKGCWWRRQQRRRRGGVAAAAQERSEGPGKVSGQDLGVQVGYADGVRGFLD